MAYVCADVPRLTKEVAEKQGKLDRAVKERDDARAKMERKGEVWEGSEKQAHYAATIAEEEAKLADAQANLVEAQADCG